MPRASAHAHAEREINRIAARLLGAGGSANPPHGQPDRSGSRPRHRRRIRSSPHWRPPPSSKPKLVDVREDSWRWNARQLAEVRAEAQAHRARSRTGRAPAGARLKTEATDWTGRRESAQAQIATLETAHRGEMTTERRSLEDAPQAFAQQRTALIGEIEQAETERRACRGPNLPRGRKRAGRRRQATPAPRSKRMGTAREELARAEERHEGAKRRLHRNRPRNPRSARSRAGRRRRAGRTRARRRSRPDSPIPKPNSKSCAASASGLARSTCAPRKNCARSKTQHTKLTAERDDLVEAIKRLRQGIQNLNKEARERLLASFEVVNNHFQRLFTELFSGGTAELQLIEQRRSARSRPRHSGQAAGQEAGVAVAAVRRRAGADGHGADLRGVPHQSGADLRAGRSGRAARRSQRRPVLRPAQRNDPQSTDTRFVIITHNPITMARMNRLFGVTMAERGVSQLVSVDLDDAVKDPRSGCPTYFQ